MSKIVDLRGTSLSAAVVQFGDPEVVEELRTIRRAMSPRVFGITLADLRQPLPAPTTTVDLMASLQKYNELKGWLERRLLDQLEWGQLMATALEAPVRPGAGRVIILPEQWDELRTDIARSLARGPNGEYACIEVRRPASRKQIYDWAEGVPGASGALPGPSPVRPPVATCPIQLSNDNRTLKIGENTFLIGGLCQQKILSRLIDAFERGERLKAREVLRDADSAADTLAKAFHNSRHWPLLKSVLRQENGFCWLEPCS